MVGLAKACPNDLEFINGVGINYLQDLIPAFTGSKDKILLVFVLYPAMMVDNDYIN